MRPIARALLLACLTLALGCAGAGLERPHREAPPAPAPEPTAASAEIDPAILERAQDERREYLEHEVTRLRADLQQAEDSILQLESGERGLHTRAHAVSAVAEARTALDSVTRDVPWRRDRVSEARAVIEEADRQLAADHLGSAIYFASRAQRTTEALRAEAQQVANWSERRVIRGDRVNLRAAPSETGSVVDVLARATPLYPERSFQEWMLVRTPDGRVGWVHRELLN